MAELQFDNDLLFVVAGFIPASKSARLLFRAGINPAPAPTTFWWGRVKRWI